MYMEVSLQFTCWRFNETERPPAIQSHLWGIWKLPKHRERWAKQAIPSHVSFQTHLSFNLEFNMIVYPSTKESATINTESWSNYIHGEKSHIFSPTNLRNAPRRHRCFGKNRAAGFLVGGKFEALSHQKAKVGLWRGTSILQMQKMLFSFFQGIVGCAPTNVPLWETPI